jgi:hypothetical protein
MAGVLPKTEAPTITPRTGQSNRQRKESRLDRASFSCGPGGGLVFSPADTWREHPQAPERRGFHSIQTIQRRGFSGAGLVSFFPRGTSSCFSRRRHPNCGADATAPGFSNRGCGPLLSHPGRMAARVVPGRDGLRPVRRTTTNAEIPGGGSRPAERRGPNQAPDVAVAVRPWTTPRFRCPGRQARLASLLRSHVEERSAVTATMTALRLSLSTSACLSVRRWKGIAGTGSCPPRWMSLKARGALTQIRKFRADPLSRPLPHWGRGDEAERKVRVPYAAHWFFKECRSGRGAHELAPVRPLAKVPKAPFKALCLWPLPLAIPGVTSTIFGP